MFSSASSDPSLLRLGAPACALILSVALAACALPIEPAESGIGAPDRFVAGGAAPAPAAAPDPAWWREFGAPDLDRLMAAAMEGNLDMAAAIARMRQADEALRIAGAQLLPLVEGSASVGRARGTSATPGVPANAGRQYGGSVQASYQIDFWGGLQAQERAARDSVAAAEFGIGTVTLTTQSAVASTLFDLLGAREQLAVQQDNLRIAERTLAILRQRLAAGTATGLDVAQQEAVVAQQRAQIPPLQQTVEADTFALATLAGLRPADITVTGQRLTAIRVPEIAPGLPSALLARRPDVRLAEANLAAASADVAAARAALFPTIALTAEGGLQSIALQTLLRPGATIYSIAVGLTQTLFDGGALRAQLAQTRARREELLATYRQAILAALQDTETSLSALQRNRELVVLQTARAEAAQRAYAVAEAQFRAGTIDLLTVLNTQTTLFNARSALAQAQASRLQAAAALFTALGGGWTVESVRLAQAGAGRTTP
ncbi:efflux transporter outer membrane subunit [Roseomonas eburnea]|uniref:Efflux transporter outer membrane subunit n=1 Tax=Neoroseomonas eburnea TaxID=1346889 RepID=A0A9X9XIW7_9PROT|nr:efflux transporter outer membrane subunit [Neoroseomonas eburnea]MBR0683653.1 efflux transporter outer membrane subunit [Neoroseomonas eburnea]